jgi:FAD-dependent urate hydroxylase
MPDASPDIAPLDPAAARRLARLARQVQRDLAILDGANPRRWTAPTAPDGQNMLDVLVVGGGQGGLGTAFALRREGILSVRVIDRAPRGREGPWRTYARMHLLRTPKTAVGMDLGIPSLTARAWFEARYGRAAWDGMTAFPREDWNAYLDWYRDTLGIVVENGVALERVEPEGDGLRLILSGPAGAEIVRARKLVLATGLQGAGTWYIPDLIRQRLPPERYAHGASMIDFARLRGRRVAVIGAGASGFDNAAVALEEGAEVVDLFMRRTELPRVNPLMWFDFSAALAHFVNLPDLHRWRMGRDMVDHGIPPPETALRRCHAHPNFTIRTGAIWRDILRGPDGFEVITDARRHRYDFVICATSADPSPLGRPELSAIADDVAHWEDRFTPPAGEESAALGRYPYLGPAYEFTERHPGTAPWLRHIHCFSFGAVGSMGSTGGVPSLKYALPRLVRGIMKDLFLAEADRHLVDFLAFERGALPLPLTQIAVQADDDPAEEDVMPKALSA